MRRGFQGRWLLPLAAGLLLVPRATTHASTGYPAEIRTQLGLSYTPSCSICHQGGDTDAGTVTTAFGTTMVSFGLAGGNNLTSLDGALAGLEGGMSPYITDLKDGLDPNHPNTGSVPPNTNGCHVTGQAATAGPAGLLVLGLTLLYLLGHRERRT